MIERLQHFIAENHLFTKDDRILLAISGGIDSMVFLHLFEQTDYNYGVVHCNFQLRGDESDEEQFFVRKMISAHGVPFCEKKFDTKEYATINGISIEMAARELRYQYFEELLDQYSYNYLATAHHQNDVIETFFLNISRKTGIKGLTGIAPKRTRIVRPMLFTNRNEIEKYAHQHFIEYREDSSNHEVVYKRNFLRHKILPLFKELNSAFNENLLATIDNLKEVEQLYQQILTIDEKKVLQVDDLQTSIDVEALQHVQSPKLLLLEILNDYNFNAATVHQVYERLDTISGKQFFSATHRLVKDRNNLYITPLSEVSKRQYYIDEDDLEIFQPLDITLDYVNAKDFTISNDKNIGCFDADKLSFPLLIRHWQQGDYFQPLGMEGFKKVSDFLIDEKIPLHEKERIWLLCNGNEIIWIIGYRIDNRYKITESTKKVLRIKTKKTA